RRVARRRLLRAADLLRFLRLLRHGHRLGPAIWLRTDREFLLPLRRGIDHRLLAALAHLAVELVPRLRLHPARRQPPRADPDDDEPHGRLHPVRPVARGELEFPRLGPVARRLPRARAIRPRRSAESIFRRRALAAAACIHARRRAAELGLLPRRRFDTRRGVADGDVRPWGEGSTDASVDRLLDARTRDRP